ncbi:dephospho-CoA kinase [Geothrix sp. PMB-07]|uniref:dephospho-CoA kinase n=1 Tax=Geothrix sp. PMB-07 TaxID=3068640 RepID=UPI0027404933|nr:dephospho-CoA kinase [Geothrix sp. PMB-07]WLT30120.1 dephospho-CoA kinase [Geothrix sp. PMB-07]
MFLFQAPFPLLGLSGGIAAGKSFVASRLASRGWVVIDADALAREVVVPGSEGLREVAAAFGPQALNADGSLDRVWVGAQVFSDASARTKLNAILHPRIEALLNFRLKELPANTRGAVLDAALWVERGIAHHFDAFWTVDAPESLRLERLMVRDGMDREAALARLRAQASPAERALHADLVIPNDGRDLSTLLEGAEAALLSDWKIRRKRIWRPNMPAPFSADQLRDVLTSLLSRGGDYGEVFVERRRAHALGMDDGRMEDVLASETFGASLRLVDGDTTRFADLIAPTFDELVASAHTLAAPGHGSAATLPALTVKAFPTPSPVAQDPGQVPLADKVALVRKAETIAREHAETLRPGALKQVAVGYGDSTQRVWIAAAELKQGAWSGSLTEDHRIQVVLRANVTAGDGTQLQTGYQPLGETRGFELFTDEAVTRMVHEAVRLAIQALDAQPAPAGTFPVVLSSSAGGTMIHEACGHGLEADLALAGMSSFAGKLGQKVAAEGVTIIDDGTLPHKRGSQAIDDEGNPVSRVVLIENGILKAYLQSRKTSRKMDVEPTGNGRRESYRHLPIPRMRNTFLAAGSEAPEAILRDLDRGLLVKHMGGGQVDTVTGNFVFQVTEGYWVENGEAKYPVKNATLSGCGPEVLKGLTRIGSDLHHFDIGTCGKDGQGVPVSDALPTILCPALVVGGTAEALPSVM